MNFSTTQENIITFLIILQTLLTLAAAMPKKFVEVNGSQNEIGSLNLKIFASKGKPLHRVTPDKENGSPEVIDLYTLSAKDEVNFNSMEQPSTNILNKLSFKPRNRRQIMGIDNIDSAISGLDRMRRRHGHGDNGPRGRSDELSDNDKEAFEFLQAGK